MTEGLVESFAALDDPRRAGKVEHRLVDVPVVAVRLAEISREVAPGAHAVLVLDGAGWHRAGGELRAPAHITLLHLPPHAPEPNPIENLWAFLRGNKLANRTFNTCDAILDPCRDAWNEFPQPARRSYGFWIQNWYIPENVSGWLRSNSSQCRRSVIPGSCGKRAR